MLKDLFAKRLLDAHSTSPLSHSLCLFMYVQVLKKMYNHSFLIYSQFKTRNWFCLFLSTLWSGKAFLLENSCNAVAVGIVEMGFN